MCRLHPKIQASPGSSTWLLLVSPAVETTGEQPSSVTVTLTMGAGVEESFLST